MVKRAVYFANVPPPPPPIRSRLLAKQPRSPTILPDASFLLFPYTIPATARVHGVAQTDDLVTAGLVTAGLHCDDDGGADGERRKSSTALRLPSSQGDYAALAGAEEDRVVGSKVEGGWPRCGV